MQDDDTRQPDMVTYLQRFADAVDPAHRNRGNADDDSADDTRYTAEEVEAIRDVWRRRAHDARMRAIQCAAERNALIRYARWLQDNRGGDIYGEECPSDEEIAAAQAEHGVAALLEDT